MSSYLQLYWSCHSGILINAFELHSGTLITARHFSTQVIKESGPPHMRTFVTRCSCGEYITDGEGNSKKVSKKRAAEKMLEELQKLPPMPQNNIAKLKNKQPATKKKNRNLIKVKLLFSIKDFRT